MGIYMYNEKFLWIFRPISSGFTIGGETDIDSTTVAQKRAQKKVVSVAIIRCFTDLISEPKMHKMDKDPYRWNDGRKIRRIFLYSNDKTIFFAWPNVLDGPFPNSLVSLLRQYFLVTKIVRDSIIHHATETGGGYCTFWPYRSYDRGFFPIHHSLDDYLARKATSMIHVAFEPCSITVRFGVDRFDFVSTIYKNRATYSIRIGYDSQVRYRSNFHYWFNLFVCGCVTLQPVAPANRYCTFSD